MRTFFFILFFFFFFAFHFWKRQKFVLGLPKSEFSTGKKHFTSGKKSGKITLPPQKNMPVTPLLTGRGNDCTFPVRGEFRLVSTGSWKLVRGGKTKVKRAKKCITSKDYKYLESDFLLRFEDFNVSKVINYPLRLALLDAMISNPYPLWMVFYLAWYKTIAMCPNYYVFAAHLHSFILILIFLCDAYANQAVNSSSLVSVFFLSCLSDKKSLNCNSIESTYCERIPIGVSEGTPRGGLLSKDTCLYARRLLKTHHL